MFVPAIGAEPRETWARPGFDDRRLDLILHDRLSFTVASINLYDHLTKDERKLEVKPSRGPNDEMHKDSVEKFAAAKARVAEYGVKEWGDRFRDAVQRDCRVHILRNRPMIFVCHSTGGSVVKQALSRQSQIADLCLGVTFFATPHHGSSVLSELEYVQTVQKNLRLKWEMSQRLRRDFRLRNPHLETLNSKFAVNIFRAKIYSYVEDMDTDLSVLSTDDAGVETLTNLRLCTVDNRCARLSTSSIPFEDEEILQLHTTHVGAPRFEGEDTLQSLYLDRIAAFVETYSDTERHAQVVLNDCIMECVQIDVHQFYQSMPSMKIMSTHPSIRDFLNRGPTQCIEARLQEIDDPRPSRSSDRFKWIHVPFSHTGWVPHVLSTISQESGDIDLHEKVLSNRTWISQHNRPLHASPHARFVRPGVRFLERSHGVGGVGIATPSSTTRDTQLVLYLPYLHWDSFKNLQKREAVIHTRRQSAQDRLQALQEANLGSEMKRSEMELKVIWQYLTSDLPIHCRRTLDQYGNPNLRSTSYRDRNQTLYKRTKADVHTLTSKEFPLKEGHWSSAGRRYRAADDTIDAAAGVDAAIVDETAKVLMVDQLWLWIMDDQTIITFFNSKEKEKDDNGLSREGDLRSEIFQDINGDYANQCVNPYDFAALVVLHAIKAFPERTADRNLQFLRIFDEYVSILTESQINSFRQFRDNQRFSVEKDRSAMPYFDNRIELDALLELRDIDDELATITKLIKEQQAFVSDMIAQYHNLETRCQKELNGMGFLKEVQQFLNEQREQITEMLNNSQATQAGFKELLDMKQKHAIRISQEQTERAADSSRSIMVFTIFTIIFSPLSFLASVFGINAREWSGSYFPCPLILCSCRSGPQNVVSVLPCPPLRGRY